MATNPYDFTNSTQVNKGIVASNMAAPQVTPTTTQVSQTNTSAYNPNTVDVKGVQQASTYNPATATATDWSVGKDQTVAGQLEGILSSNSPLLQRAQTKALQGMNSRGLLNSSMAIGAGEAALYDAALPIAQADASTFATAGKYKADVANNMSQFNTTAQNNAAQYNAGATQQASKDNAAAKNALQSQLLQTTAQMDLANTDAKNKAAMQDSQQGLQAQLANQETATKIGMQSYDAAVKAAMQDADAQNKLQLQNLDAFTRQRLMDTEAKYKNQMQANQSIAQTYQSMIDSFTKIIQDKDLDGQSKANIVNQLGEMYDANLATLASMGGLKLDLNFNYGETGSGAISGVTRTAKDAASPNQALPNPANPQEVSSWQDRLVNTPNPPEINGRTKDADGGVTTWYKDGRGIVRKPDGTRRYGDPRTGVEFIVAPNGSAKMLTPLSSGWQDVSVENVKEMADLFLGAEASREFWS